MSPHSANLRDIVILGAGPYGLSLAAHLRAQNLGCTLIGTPMEHWERFMPKGMLLRSEANASSISAPGGQWSLKQYCAEQGITFQPIGWPVPVEIFIDYARWFRNHAVGPILDQSVVSLQQEGDYFRLQLANGEALLAARVVMATGLRDFRIIPPTLLPLPPSHMSHSCDLGDLTRFAGRDMTIIGGGQSALGLAALLHELGTKVRVLARRPMIDWNGKPQSARSFLSHVMQPDSGLGAGWRGFILSNFPGLFRLLPTWKRQKMVAHSWGPSGAWWLKDRVLGKVELLPAHEVSAARLNGEAVELVVKHGGLSREIRTDFVIAATGFKSQIQQIPYLSAKIRESMAHTGNAPELSAHFETSIPGLFALGQASAQSFGPVMRFVYGTHYATPKLAKYLQRTARKHVRQTPPTAENTAYRAVRS